MGSLEEKEKEESNDTKRQSFVASVLRIHEGVGGEREGVSPWERLLFPRLSAIPTYPLGKCWIRINSVTEAESRVIPIFLFLLFLLLLRIDV